MSEPLPNPDDINDEAADRSSERRSFFLGATLVFEAVGSFQAKVRNLSAGGMMIELDQAPDPEWAPGDRLSVELRNIGLIKGEVAWAGGRRFGIKFDREIDPELARKPATGPKDVTPDFLRPIRVADRNLGKLTQSFQSR